MEHPLNRAFDVIEAERRVRDAVRFDVGEAMMSTALREAMRLHTFDSYRQGVFKDSASMITIVARAG